MFGLLNIYKPVGMTSHDVVAVLRRALHIKQIGHTGTLDPFAEGVLPICIGKATRLIEYLPDDKEYLATVQFGAATTTYDTEGEKTFISDKKITEADIDLTPFKGEIEQFPPIYSAIKVKGKKLYEYARQGLDVEIHPRKVTIEHIELKKFDENLQRAQILIKCSKGTYIRSIANDLGQNLGCGAHLIKLIRTQAGKFRVENSIELDKINSGTPLINPLEMLDLPVIEVTKADLEKIRHGMPIPSPLAGEGAVVRAKRVTNAGEGLNGDIPISPLNDDTHLLTYSPTNLLTSNNLVSLVYNNTEICAIGERENSKIKLKKVFIQ